MVSRSSSPKFCGQRFDSLGGFKIIVVNCFGSDAGTISVIGGADGIRFYS
jgi:hypothetical protein